MDEMFEIDDSEDVEMTDLTEASQAGSFEMAGACVSHGGPHFSS